MLKTSLKIILALALAFVAYLFWQAGQSEQVRPALLEATPAVADGDVLTVAFGSCNKQNADQDYWNTIGRHRPDVWLWLGDNVYADKLGMDQLDAAYDQVKTNPHYRSFVASLDGVYGIYDDHDYGLNDGGKEFADKDRAKASLLRFLDVPADAAVRSRAGSYQSYLVGDGQRRVKVILLDSRYFRDELAPATARGHRYGANPTGDILGSAQWAWLEAELRQNDAAAHVIASSIQVLPTEHGYEKWANFPAARQRLIALLNSARPNLPVLLSGDRHLAEISELTVGDYPIYEITASGLTHSYESADEPNALRVSPLIGQKNYGLLHYVWPTEDRPELLAEVRGIEDDAVLASLALTTDLTAADKTTLNAVVNGNRDMTDQLKPCPASPNCVSTQTDQTDKKRDPIAYTGSLADAKTRLMAVVDAMPRTRLKEEAGNYLHYTFKTWPIPFIDDVEFLFDDEAKVIHYRSASRVGHSDLGANGKRMARVVKAYMAATE